MGWEALVPLASAAIGAYMSRKKSEPEPQVSQMTITPGPYESEKAEQGATVGRILIPYLMTRMMGVPTAGDKRTLNYQLAEMKRQMGMMGVEPGDPRVAENIRKLMENLSMPKTGLINMLQSIYSGASTDIGRKTSETVTGGGQKGSALTGAVQGLSLYKVLKDSGLFDFGKSATKASTTGFNAPETTSWWPSSYPEGEWDLY